MAKEYFRIDSHQRLGVNDRLIIDKNRIKLMFGVARDCIESTSVKFKVVTHKFAFYNTGELCEVSFEEGSMWLKVECHCLNSRCTDILGWLKTNLVNDMNDCGIVTDIVMQKNHFNARFYPEEI